MEVICHSPRVFFFFNDTATTEIYTLSLHDALPIFRVNRAKKSGMVNITSSVNTTGYIRSEERFSRNAETDLVCRLLLEKKKNKRHWDAADQSRPPRPIHPSNRRCAAHQLSDLPFRT